MHVSNHQQKQFETCQKTSVGSTIDMAPKPDMPSADDNDDRKVSADDVVEEAAFYRRLFESNDPTTVMLRDALSRSTDVNHVQHLIKLHSSGSRDAQTSHVSIHAHENLPSLMQRSVGTEAATEANLTAMRSIPKEVPRDFIATGTSGQTSYAKPPAARGIDIVKGNESALLGFMKGARQLSATSGKHATKKGGGEAQFVRDFMKQTKGSPKLKKVETDFLASFMKSIRKNEDIDASPVGDHATVHPGDTIDMDMDMEDKELFRHFMLSSMGIRSTGEEQSTDFTKNLEASAGGENEFLKFLKSFDAKQTYEKGESALLKYMRSMSLIGFDQKDASNDVEIGAGHSSVAFMWNVLQSTDFSTDALKALEPSKTLGGISPQASVCLNAQESIPRGVSLDLEQRFRPSFLNFQPSHGHGWNLPGRQIYPMNMVPPMVRGFTYSNWNRFDNSMVPPNAIGTGIPIFNEGDKSAAEAAMALASMQPREDEMVRRKLQHEEASLPKRKRQRKVHEPAQKKFVEVNINDCLFGR